MKLTHLTALGLCATALGAAYGCSSPEAERQPIYANANSGGTTGTTGGKAGTGGSMQAMTGTGGKVINVGSGGASGTGGNKAVGTGGTPAAMGGTSSGAGGGNNNNTGGKSGGTGGGNTGGGNNANTGGGGAVDCTTPTAAIVAAILKAQGCDGCHKPDNANHPDVFTTATGLDAVAQGEVSDEGCGAGVVISPGDAMMSGLYRRIAATDVANCGRMPRVDGAVGSAFTPSELACVAAWINSLTPP
ncbi:MAG: hypothetical protein SFV15_25200 [Polyangiaceae bacterium]|nr:hypothetical protein [Polyangiaceae bacterium]